LTGENERDWGGGCGRVELRKGVGGKAKRKFRTSEKKTILKQKKKQRMDSVPDIHYGGRKKNPEGLGGNAPNWGNPPRGGASKSQRCISLRPGRKRGEMKNLKKKKRGVGCHEPRIGCTAKNPNTRKRNKATSKKKRTAKRGGMLHNTNNSTSQTKAHSPDYRTLNGERTSLISKGLHEICEL